ncbi:MAG: bifunctional [glutamine synthetase] adenylyltransferase/[glutamine synthetase]-adenylyl-L-tyrosine phosphorylase [Pseudomonadota bacterium]
MADFLKFIKSSLPIYDGHKGEVLLDDFKARLAKQNDLTFLKGLFASSSPSDPLPQLLMAVFSASSYLTRLIFTTPSHLQTILQSGPQECLDHFISELQESVAQHTAHQHSLEQAEMMRVLRIFKQKIALLTALADCAGCWDVIEATAALTKAADAAVQSTLQYLFSNAQHAGDVLSSNVQCPEHGSGYFVLGMGKYGAHELNYSSDIDLIIFYDLNRASLRPGLEPSVFFVKLTRQLAKLLQERTSDGYVFRVDLRLRPDPGSTQVAISTHSALFYYETSGQNWERAAYIKARLVAGDEIAGQNFLQQLLPFVWRKYLDYVAIAEVHSMKRQLHVFKGHSKIAVAGHNIKLGRGGIREIEFFVQTQQLIAAGRHADLRLSKTLDALDQLVKKNWINENVSKHLREAYLFLRHVEHRLQMLADEQTHTLPKSEDDLQRIACFSGFLTYDDFAKQLMHYLQSVEKHYAQLFENLPEAQSDAHQFDIPILNQNDKSISHKVIEKLKNVGFAEPEKAIHIIRGWHTSKYPAMRSEKVRQRLIEFQPVLIEALSKTVMPDQALISFDRFLGNLPAGLQLFSLLKNNSGILQLIAEIMGTAPRLAAFLSRYTYVLDILLDPDFFGPLPTNEELRELLNEQLANTNVYEEMLDTARYIGQEHAFIIGGRLLSQSISAQEASKAYSNLAENLIESLQDQVDIAIQEQYGQIQNGDVAVLSMGKLGGHEMTASSDLDIILIYDFDPSCVQSDGPKQISPAQYYSKFTQRLISALSVPTSTGGLYEVDMRLRPSGKSGPVATMMGSFENYQNTQAWTWEHMALTRARVISGTEPLRKKLNEVIKQVLCLPRDKGKIAQDICDMRRRIEHEKKTDNLWDLKHYRGGLIDLEFIVQYLQLIHAHKHPEVLDQNTMSALSKLQSASLIRQEHANSLISAGQLFHDFTQILRLCISTGYAPATAPEGLNALLVRYSQEPAIAQLEARLVEAMAEVQSIYNEIIGEGS